ncbi:MAG TPA: DUF2461 domain-containing protein [Jatrophihabitans sp.]
MAFSGIPFAALDFYEDLEADNSKSYWTAHKQVYDESVRIPITELVAELTDEFGPGKYFRPYRDVRFSKDKRPYKDHQGVYFGESRRYFHVSAAGLFVGGGYYDMASDQIERYRRAVDSDVTGHRLLKAIGTAEQAKLELGGQLLTRVPSGFDKHHAREELLRRKSLTSHREFGSPQWLTTKRAKAELVKAWRAMHPVIDWLETNVGPSNQAHGR